MNQQTSWPTAWPHSAAEFRFDFLTPAKSARNFALSAVQGLNQKVEAENSELRAENADLKRRLDALEKAILDRKMANNGENPNYLAPLSGT